MERPLYLAAAMTGLRQGELITLPWLDIDWLARRIRVADNFPRGRVDERDSPKSHEGRSVPMADRVAAGLERHFQRTRYRADTDLVFCHPETGGPMDPSKMGKRFKKALKRAGLREITFHELRHTFGTQLAATGVPLRVQVPIPRSAPALPARKACAARRPGRSSSATRTSPQLREPAMARIGFDGHP